MTVKTWNWPPNEAGKVVGWSNSGKELVNRSIDDVSMTEVQFDKPGALYSVDGHDTDAAVKISGELTETPRAGKKTLLHAELTDVGSGTAEGPALNGTAISASVFKKNWPDVATSEDGEILAYQAAFRQANGDASCLLGNGVIMNGFGCLFEANILSLEPVTFAIKHQVSASAAVNNDRDDEYYGLIAAKSYAAGGTAFLAHTTLGGSWDYGIEIKNNGSNQLQQRVSDAALILFQYDNAANYYGLKVVSGVMKLFDSAGATGVFATAAKTDYTPTVTASGGGAATTTTITGRWMKKSDKVRQVSIRAVMTDIGTLSGVFRFTLPADVTTDGRYFTYWTGQNLATGAPIYCWVQNNTGYVSVYSAAGGSPGTSGQNLQFAGEYETV